MLPRYEISFNETPIEDTILHTTKKKKNNTCTTSTTSKINQDYDILSTSLKVIQTSNNKISKTPSSINYNRPSCVIVSIIEYRQKREVGIAIINLKSATLSLYQIADSQRYGNIIMILHQQNPNEIIVSDTTNDTTLTQIIKNEFEWVQIIEMKRKFFNEEQGVFFLNKYSTAESKKNMDFIDDSSKFLCFSAASALLKYVEHIQCINFAPNSLNIVLKSLDGHMKLHIKTIKHLELVYSQYSLNQNSSLLSFMDHCKTKQGSRLLRANILQPLTDYETIKLRLETVEFLLQNESLFFDLSKILGQICDLDQLYAQFVQIPKNETEKIALTQIANLILLKRSMELTKELQKSLQNFQNNIFLKSILESLKHDCIPNLLNEIGKIITKDHISNATKQSDIKRPQIIFCVQTGINALLDVARATYLETSDEIQKEFEKLRNSFPNLFSLKLNFTNYKGFYLSFITPLENIPECFINIVKAGKSTNCSTSELISLNDRLNEAYTEILLMTNQVIFNLLNEIRRHMHVLICIAESVAYLDLLWNFAYLVTQNENYVKPELNEKFPFAIKEGRNPIKEKVLNVKFVPNDTFFENTVIVWGPNGSGKSTYLRQLALIQIMAQIGSFVPAQWVNLRIIDQIFAVLAQDCLSIGNSSFLQEVNEASYVLNAATQKSFIIFDELGRSTSNIDASALCFSIFEHIILKINCLCAISTHIYELYQLRSLYPERIRVFHFGLNLENGHIIYNYKITEDENYDYKSYAIEICKNSGFPNSIIAQSFQIYNFIKSNGHVKTLSDEYKNNESIVQKLGALRFSKLKTEDLKNYLKDLHVQHFIDKN